MKTGECPRGRKYFFRVFRIHGGKWKESDQYSDIKKEKRNDLMF